MLFKGTFELPWKVAAAPSAIQQFSREAVAYHRVVHHQVESEPGAHDAVKCILDENLFFRKRCDGGKRDVGHTG